MGRKASWGVSSFQLQLYLPAAVWIEPTDFRPSPRLTFWKTKTNVAAEKLMLLVLWKISKRVLELCFDEIRPHCPVNGCAQCFEGPSGISLVQRGRCLGGKRLIYTGPQSRGRRANQNDIVYFATFQMVILDEVDS